MGYEVNHFFNHNINTDRQQDLRPSRLFDHIPGGYYFSKDRAGRFIYCNQNLVEWFNCSNSSEIIGKTDFDILRIDLAEEYRQEDEKVMSECQGYFNKANLVVDHSGRMNWFMTTKVPLKDDHGNVVGIEGFMLLKQENEEKESFLLNPFEACLEYIEENFNENISIQTLANKSHMSKSTFFRKFRETYGASPSSYIKKFRLEMACKFLKAGYHLSEVASRCGFCDQSHFTKDFRQYKTLTPRQYQLKFKTESIGAAV